jgi:hypothetical protein
MVAARGLMARRAAFTLTPTGVAAGAATITRILHQPAFSLAVIKLQPGQSIKAEAGRDGFDVGQR